MIVFFLLKKILIFTICSYIVYWYINLKINMFKVKLLCSAAIFSFLFVYVIDNQVVAQDYSRNIWYFGNSPQGLMFTRPDNTAEIINNQNNLFGNGGSAVATDMLNMDLLFYTDGTRVYDARHQAMPGGNLNGNPASNQPVALAPVPNVDDRYIIFTNSATFTTPGTISYSIVDMTLNVPDPQANIAYGELTTVNQLAGINNVAEGMITVSSNDLSQFYLITTAYNSTEINVYEIVGPTTFNLVSTANVPSPMIAGNLNYSRANGKIAVAPQSQNANVQLLDFDANTGTITYDQAVVNSFNSDFVGQAIYDTEWSPNGQFLYLSRHGGTGDVANIYQFDLNNVSNGLQEVIDNDIFRSYGLQSAPDGNIYHLYQNNAAGNIRLGVINEPDSVFDLVQYQAQPFDNDNFNGRQFPQFLPRMELPPLGINFTYLDSCQNDITKFFPTVPDDSEPLPDSYRWDFGDGGGSSTAVAPVYEYQNPGVYNVTLIVTRGGQADTVTSTVNIIQNDNQLQLPADTVICPDEVLTLDPGSGGVSYSWSTGETSQTIDVDTTGYYWVAVEYGNGCTLYGGLRVDEYPIQVNTSNIWYFGNQAGLDFNPQPPPDNPPVPLLDGQMSAPEGVATQSDQNGDLLFYTDGVTVWGRDHSIIGDNIGGGQRSTQSVFIMPFEDDETMYYVITTEEIFGDNTYNLNYSVVDIKENNANGAVVLQNLHLFAPSTERIAGAAQDATFFFAHEFGNNVFRAYVAAEEGLRGPIISSIGSVHDASNQANGEGYLRVDGTDVAVGLSGPTNAIELFEIDTLDLTLTNYRRIEITNAPYPQYSIYGIEMRGSKLFVSLLSSGGSIINEYYIDTTDVSYIENNFWNLYDDSERLGALQTAPNGQIMIAHEGATSLGVINPRDTLDQSTLQLNFVDLGGRTSELGLPNNIDQDGNAFGDPLLTVGGPGCIGTSVAFNADTTSIIDEVAWTIRRASDNSIVHSSTETEFDFIFNDAGLYDVGLRMFNRCGLDTTLTATVEIFPNPEDPTIPTATALCSNDLTLDMDTLNRSNLIYVWSTGDSTQQITISEVGVYQATIVDQNGCTSDRETTVVDGRPIFDLGLDQTVCQDENVSPLNTGISALADFTWYVNGVNQNHENPSLAVNTDTPGDYEYVVSVLDPITTCVANDTVEYTVNPEPSVAAPTTTPATCNVDNGEIQIPANPDNYNINWYDDAASLLASDVLVLDNIGGGTYTLELINSLTGCTSREDIGLSDVGTIIVNNINPLPGCDSLSAFELDLGGTVNFPLQLTLSNNTSGSEFDITQSGPATTFTVPDIDEGDYVIEITDNVGCVLTENATVGSLPNTSYTVTINGECSPAQVTASITDPNPVYDWRDEFGSLISDADTASIANAGANEITLTVDSDNCPVDTTFTVNVYSSPAVAITPVANGCQENLTLRADPTPTGNYSYVWSNNGSPVPNSSLQTINFNTVGTYSIDLLVSNQQTGCTASAGPQDFEVYEEIVVNLTSSQACDDGNPILLTAEGNLPGLSYGWFRGSNQISSQNTDTLSVFDEGIFRVVGTLNVCSDADTTEVNRLPTTDPELQERYLYCAEDPNPDNNFVIIEPENTFIEYEWYSLESNNLLGMDPTLVVSGGLEGNITTRLTNAFGCVTLDTVLIENDCEPRVFIPTAFTPNNDGNNDQFTVEPLFVTDFEVYIFSRWGELIFYSNEQDFEWDGTYNGKILPMGTYAYKVTFKSETSPERGTIEKRGGVTLLK